jgi:hypothetical protein
MKAVWKTARDQRSWLLDLRPEVAPRQGGHLEASMKGGGLKVNPVMMMMSIGTETLVTQLVYERSRIHATGQFVTVTRSRDT